MKTVVVETLVRNVEIEEETIKDGHILLMGSL